MMEEVLDSVRRIISRWTITSTPLRVDANSGDTILTVRTAIRFQAGNQCTLISMDNRGETNLYIKRIVDPTHIELVSPLQYDFPVSENPVLNKTINGLFVQGIYIGDPDPIPFYPAITVNGTGRDSEWITMDSTKEIYNVDINIYVQDSSQEAGYRFLLKMADIVQNGLKSNIYPLVAPYSTSAITSNVAINDFYIKIGDTSILFPDRSQRVLLEDSFKVQELHVDQIIDSTTFKVSPAVCDNYLVSDGANIVSMSRFIFNSWPKAINYGLVHKGTLLKAATITWFAWEEELQGSVARLEPPLL